MKTAMPFYFVIMKPTTQNCTDTENSKDYYKDGINDYILDSNSNK